MGKLDLFLLNGPKNAKFSILECVPFGHVRSLSIIVFS